MMRVGGGRNSDVVFQDGIATARRRRWQAVQRPGARDVGGLPQAWVDFFNAHLPKPPARVLDLGCGDGSWVHGLTSQGYDATGVDLHAGDEDPRVLRGDIEAPLMGQVAGGRFDVVILMDTLEHVVDDVQVLQNAYDALHPGGVLFISTKAGAEVDKEHLRHYEVGSLRHLTELVGFTWLDGKVLLGHAEHPESKFPVAWARKPGGSA